MSWAAGPYRCRNMWCKNRWHLTLHCTRLSITKGMAYQLKGEQNLNDIFMFLVSSTSFLRYLYFEASWDELKLCTVLVHLFCPLHSPFRDLRLSNANRTNPPEAKRSKLAPDALITLKTPRASRATLLLHACVPHSRVMCNEMELKNANFTLKLCWES